MWCSARPTASKSPGSGSPNEPKLTWSFARYSKRAKELLASYNITPPPKVVELDIRSDGPQVQAILARLTERNTVPNILLKVISLNDFQYPRS